MTARLIGNFMPGSPEWHAARADGVGASEVAAVLGLSPFESRFSLWHRKAGLLDPDDETDQTRRGHYLEPAVAAWFADEHPEYRVRLAGSYCHERRPWQRVNPDRLLTRAPRGRKATSLLEIKSAHKDEEWGTGPQDVPIHYRIQLMWALDVFGLDYGWLAVITRNLDFRAYRIEYNVVEAGELRDMVREFLDTVEAGQPPDIDAHGQTYKAIRQLHPEIDGTGVELDPDMAEDFIDARIDLKNADSADQLQRNRVADVMGNAQYAECNGHTIARRQAKNGGTPYLVAARKLPNPEDLRERTAA